MLSAFRKSASRVKYVWKRDQEKAVQSMVERAIQTANRDAQEEAQEEQDEPQLHQPVPEHSAVGESASNGFAERGVQSLEGLIRTMKHALQARLDEALDVNHPVMTWLIVHASNTLNQYHVHRQTMQTAYAHLHGREAQKL